MILQRSRGWPKDRLSTIAPLWNGKTVACIASGPSLTAEQCAAVRAAGLPAITVNDSYLMAPWADVTYFADWKWHGWHKDRAEFKAFAGQKCTIFSSAHSIADPEVFVLKNVGSDGLSMDPSGVVTGSHSGYQAINIATLAGAKRIVLLGYDCGRVNGKKHWFGNHPDSSEPPFPAIIARYVTMQNPLAKLGCEVVNCSPGSFLKTFEQKRLEDVLAGLVADTAGAVVSS